MKKVLYLLMLLLIPSIFYAQINPNEQRARDELKRRGLDDEAVRLRMQKKGINLETIDPSDAASVMKAEKVLQEVIAEMEAEDKQKAEKDAKPVRNNRAAPEDAKIDTLKKEKIKEIAKQSDEVVDAVKKGSSIEEAISETLIDNQEEALPPAQIYGQELFRSQRLKLYRKSEDVKPPDSYVLGVGDIIGISIWGNSEESMILEVNNEGYIKPSGMSRIYIKGVKFGDAKTLLLKKFSNYYNFLPNQFEATLNFSRTINVSIVGEAFNYGSFNIPAINTAFNALVAAGGPTDIGSVRNIKLLRAGKEPVKIDIYQYLQNPSISSDFYLEENDIIHIPIAEKTVEIQGEIFKPFRYELLDNENLFELINYAGGLRPEALLQNIEITRLQDDKEILINVNLLEAMPKNDNYKLKKGDRVFIRKIPKSFENFVTIKKGIIAPGKFSIGNNTTIKEILQRVELEPNAITSLSYIKRLKEDLHTIEYVPFNIENIKNGGADIVLKPNDELMIFTKNLYSDKHEIVVEGSVREPKRLEYDQTGTLTVKDAVFIAGGKRDYASDVAYIKRLKKDDPNGIQYLRIDLKEALDDNSTNKEKYNLIPGDTLVVLSKLTYSNEFTIKIDGEVMNPGEYKYDTSLTLKDAIELTGGLKFAADKSRIDIYRVDFEDNKKTKIVAANIEIDENYELKSSNTNLQLKPYDQIYIRTAPEFELQRVVRLNGEVRYPGKYAIVKDNERILDVVARAGGFTDEAFLEGISLYRFKEGLGYVFVDLRAAVKNPNSNHNILLADMDSIVITKQRDLVTIYGHTNIYLTYKDDLIREGKISVPFEPGKNAKYYVDKYAGGVSETGDANKIVVRTSNGIVTKSYKFSLFGRKYPKVEYKGSTIYVGRKEIKPKEEEKKKIEWDKVFQNIVAQATAVLTLVLLIKNVQ
ncbi:MAG: SLBB domain-containing protein [Saprospiraceae bacterium]|nr:SLBB domain-containing protein [Saprospiraceae bacterium]MBP7699037.1 SLBB domain-containing protein [Saprospiraceae bacterium]